MQSAENKISQFFLQNDKIIKEELIKWGLLSQKINFWTFLGNFGPLFSGKPWKQKMVATSVVVICHVEKNRRSKKDRL